MVRIEDDGEAWVWITATSRPAPESTGKYLFFSPDRELLIAIAREEIEQHGFVHAKVSRALEGPQADHVLCLFDVGPGRVGELRHRHQADVRCPGWKSHEDTDRGVYSEKFRRSVQRPASKGSAHEQPIHVEVDGGPMTLIEALDVALRDEDVRRRLRAAGSELSITALIRSDSQRRHRTTRARLSAESWRTILKAWDRGKRERAAELFEECWGTENWGGQVPEFAEVTSLTLGKL